MSDIHAIIEKLKPGLRVRGSMFPEPVEIITIVKMQESIKLYGKGIHSNQVYEPILTQHQILELKFSPKSESFRGNAKNFRLGIEAMRLGLAYEYDPYFSLSIARIDPLPHQLEAVYEYFIKLPRIRFLLADDPGAGKTIMAGLLIKELKNRGLIKRILLVTPANLTFQWERELKEKFRETFQIIRGELLRMNYGRNPWQEHDQAITSLPWVATSEEAQQSLLRSQWDLIIVDEAHKMSAYSEDKKTLAFLLGEKLSEMTDHFLLMTATPHKGDPKNFRLFLELLDKDVYGDIKSLEEAMRTHKAPFYLRRVKEALVTFPDPITGKSMSLFTKRNVETIGFEINEEELDLYDLLTRYVEDQSIKAAADKSIRARALGFTMAMLQRRFSSSIYALRRTLERMREKREEILKDPEGYRQKQLAKKIPEDFSELSDEEQQEVMADLESMVASYNPADLREDISKLGNLINQAKELESKEIETKLKKLKEVITEHGVMKDPKMKLLIFTEHKDTLDYLIERLTSWGLSVTKIHGSMKSGGRNEPGTRIFAEKEFKDSCQVLVATEAAGEGINLQFCWFMINYDIPWNPVRLEQRMGRIHRYGQVNDCLIFNFVSTNTREGRVLEMLFERIKKIENDLDPNRTGKIFNVLGDILPSNQLEKMVRDMYARNLTEAVILDRLVHDVNTERFKSITNSALEGLAKRELNLSAIVGKSAEAKERRLVPEVIEDFFIQASELSGINPKETKLGTHIFRIGKLPRTLYPIGERLEPRFGELAREYKHIIFNKDLLKSDSALEWVTPGHPLFESVRWDVMQQVENDLEQGAVYYDLNHAEPALLDVFSAAIMDGKAQTIHQRLFVVESRKDGTMEIRQPTLFLDLTIAESGIAVPEDSAIPSLPIIEQYLNEKALTPFLQEVALERIKQTETIEHHLEISLAELIKRQNQQMIKLIERKQSGDTDPLIAANIRTTQDRLDDLNNRLEKRRKEILQERTCMIGHIKHIGRAWVLPHPERKDPLVARMIPDAEIERMAVDEVIKHEKSQGREVESVEKDNRGFDLISRKPHPEDPKTAMEVRFIEVKGRAGVGEVILSNNEYKTAQRLKEDYFLYVVYNCSSKPEIHIKQNPSTLGWVPIVKIVNHYTITPDKIRDGPK